MDDMDTPGYKAPRSLSWSWRLRKNADDDRFVAEVTREAQQQNIPAQSSTDAGTNRPPSREQNNANVVNTQPSPGRGMEQGRKSSSGAARSADGA